MKFNSWSNHSIGTRFRVRVCSSILNLLWFIAFNNICFYSVSSINYSNWCTDVGVWWSHAHQSSEDNLVEAGVGGRSNLESKSKNRRLKMQSNNAIVVMIIYRFYLTSKHTQFVQFSNNFFCSSLFALLRVKTLTIIRSAEFS